MTTNTYSRRFKKPEMKRPRTIQEYCAAKKRLSINNFGKTDVTQIESMMDNEYFIVNNVKIPIKAGTLDLTKFDEKPLELIKPRTKEEKKIASKISQKRYRDKQRKIAMGLLEVEEKPDKEMTTINMPFIFRTYGIDEKKKSSDSPKRQITGIRLIEKPKVHYGQYKAKYGANIPIQQLLKTTNYLRDLAKDKGEKSKKGEYKTLMTLTEKVNKHYKTLGLFLKADNGKRYQYTEKGLIPVD